MSFHLEGPWLSTTGRRKAKQKYASSEHKRQAEANAAEWQRKVEEFGKLSPTTVKPRGPMPSLSKSLPRTPPGRTTAHIESLVTAWAPCLKAEDKKYTGTEVLGIAVQHKSCLQPIFNQEAAKDSASMRR
jgi:hypothetical protein